LLFQNHKNKYAKEKAITRLAKDAKSQRRDLFNGKHIVVKIIFTQSAPAEIVRILVNAGTGVLQPL
jgi:hypothetical protein